jgi:hypothetical protein
VHLPIEEVSRLGEPLLPIANAKAFINQCRVIVRENIPITIREWNKPKADIVMFVSNSCKEELWESLMKDFTLPVLGTTALTDAVSRKVKLWVFKKMATQSQTFKKRLYRYYLKENQAPEFTGYLEKQ